ncbi:S-adenosyl-L-methionine-dependent methyltransferase [Stereum hirsutum FP-91666 SS1]|uniref:S-adenosyl-L-methionine-dependent methyltransferase n=1 Tax=Stereum hirsutum (strain FP-91666) TaxID=721885 RepID=UPI0004449888|nr:S-adenosyl-L-methionine-dependent methyltransferase [Stereum hirsutum FP-91666 SS1]EIM83960.1 S-adenosyl-L-methionine-dependent methyltransferase [Stereum hirsutum FP-91666 SS1]
MTPRTSPLLSLAEIISSGVRTLEAAYAKEGVPYPLLDDPFKPGPLGLDADPALQQTSRLIVAAAYQIIASVRHPMETVMDFAPAQYMSSTLGTVVEAHVPDVLKDVGSQGLHAREIAAYSGAEPSMMARVLRYLATRHVFQEVTPNVFANNRVSSILVKSRSIKEIQANPATQYEGSTGAAIVGHFTNEGLKSSTAMSEYVREGYKTAGAPFNIAYSTDKIIWDYFDGPGNQFVHDRWTAAMKSGGDRFPPEIFASVFDWGKLPDDSVVVDVGGNVGTVTRTIMKAHPRLRYVVQDLDKTIVDAKGYWQEEDPEALASGRVMLQAHDFFQPQPVKDAAVFFMRVVLHDWPTTSCRAIMQNLRSAASPSTKLILYESTMPYACEAPSGFTDDKQAPPRPPYPLLPNLGSAMGNFLTMVDMQMLALMNGQERTIEDFRALGDATGWKLDAITPGMLSTYVFSTA